TRTGRGSSPASTGGPGRRSCRPGVLGSGCRWSWSWWSASVAPSRSAMPPGAAPASRSGCRPTRDPMESTTGAGARAPSRRRSKMRERAERLLPGAVLLGFVIAAVAVSLLIRDAEERAVDGLEEAVTNEVETVAAGMGQRFGGQLGSTSSALFGFELEATAGSPTG